MKSFAHFVLFGFVATSFPAVACLLLGEIVFGNFRQMAFLIAILCVQTGYFVVQFARRFRRGKSGSPAAPDATTTPRTPIYWSIIGGVAGGVCAAALVFIALPHILGIPSNAGSFDRAKMENLVAQVRNKKFSGDRQFYWTAVSGTTALSTEAPADPNLWAERIDDQDLKVVIWTKNGGHASFSYGFAYSDVPLAPDGIPKDSPVFFTSGPNEVIAHSATLPFGDPGLHSIRRIDAHWWEVYDDSRD